MVTPNSEEKKEILKQTSLVDHGKFRDFQRELNEAYLHTKKPKEQEISQEQMWKDASEGDGQMAQVFASIREAKRDLERNGLKTMPIGKLYVDGQCPHCHESISYEKNFKT